MNEIAMSQSSYNATELDTIEASSTTTTSVDFNIGAKPDVDSSSCRESLTETFDILSSLTETRETDSSLLSGVIKFCERVNKYKDHPFCLSSALHSCGVEYCTRLKPSLSTKLQKKRRGKIHVQPEAVKWRKSENGSRVSSVMKGMKKKNNPFEQKASSKKRPHSLSENVKNNEGVPKKAGQTMYSKTKLKSANSVEKIKAEL